MVLPPFELHPEVLAVLVPPWAVYYLAWRNHVREGGSAEGLRRKVTLFTLGMATLLVASMWPVHDLADEYLFSVHMVQHLLIQLVGAPLVLAGLPAWMLRAILRPRALWSATKFLTRPFVALILFNAVILATHWPAVVDLSVRNEWAHFGVHLLLFFSAVVMWWPILGPLPELPHLEPLAQMLYLFVQSIAPTIPASFLTFGRRPLYAAYSAFPRIWGISALEDMRIAGLTMKIVAGLLLWIVIGTIFFRWYADEERAEKASRRRGAAGWEPSRP